MSERICLHCGEKISLMRGAKAVFCGLKCRRSAEKNERELKTVLPIRVHSCISWANLDPIPEKCKCKFRITKEEAIQMLESGEAIDAKTRDEYLTSNAVVLLKYGGGKGVPRVDLPGKTHIERAYVSGHSSGHGKKRETIHVANDDDFKRWLSLEARIREEKASRTEEAIHYIEEVHRLTLDERAKLIVPFREDPWEGRAIFSNSMGHDDRTFGGRGVDVVQGNQRYALKDAEPKPVENEIQELAIKTFTRDEEIEIESLIEEQKDDNSEVVESEIIGEVDLVAEEV